MCFETYYTVAIFGIYNTYVCIRKINTQPQISILIKKKTSPKLKEF